MLSPSQVVSDQYWTIQIVTVDGLVRSGLLAPETTDAVALFDPEGKKTVIKMADIEQQQPSSLSVMSEGLLNSSTLEEIADLLAFLEQNYVGTTLPAASAP